MCQRDEEGTVGQIEAEDSPGCTLESRRGYEEATMDRQWEKTLGLKQEVQRLLR